MVPGGGSYVGYSVPPKLVSNDDGTFSVVAQAANVVITGTSALGFGTVEATIDSAGAAGNWTYSGQFQ